MWLTSDLRMSKISVSGGGNATVSWQERSDEEKKVSSLCGEGLFHSPVEKRESFQQTP